jgi:hypothetical protein
MARSLSRRALSSLRPKLIDMPGNTLGERCGWFNTPTLLRHRIRLPVQRPGFPSFLMFLFGVALRQQALQILLKNH